ncbi:MAG: InlB B-repeat-containing protein [Candidatus Saccharimonadales bacterium]
MSSISLAVRKHTKLFILTILLSVGTTLLASPVSHAADPGYVHDGACTPAEESGRDRDKTVALDFQDSDGVVQYCYLGGGGYLITLPTPTRDGYTFVGWGMTANSTFGDPGGYTEHVGNETFYAIWGTTNVTVTFDGQGGTVPAPIVGAPNATSSTDHGDLTVLKYPTTTRTGYIFSGWNTAADGSGTAYSTSDFVNVMPATSETLYAQWTTPPPSPTLTFNTEGGTGGASLNATEFVSDSKILFNQAYLPSKSGSVFIGWNTAVDGSGTLYALNSSYTMPATSVTLYAVYRSLPNGGDVNDDGSVDSSQTNVDSFVNPVTKQFAAVTVSDNTCSLSNVNSISAASGADSGYSYPMGLINFNVTCGTPGFTTTVKQYFYTPPAGDFVLRKYINGKYENVPGATISRETIGGQSVMVASYQVTDGGALDEDGVVNGVIIDPAGPALVNNGVKSDPNGGTPDTSYGKPANHLSEITVLAAVAGLFTVTGWMILSRKTHAKH